MTAGSDASPDDPLAPAARAVWACGAAARWLPRALAGAVLASSVFAALRLDPAVEALVPFVRRFVVLAGAVAALAVVRKGAEVRSRFALSADALHVGVGSHRHRLAFEEIRRIDWAPPFAGSTSWIPAATLVDRDGRPWRLPALIDDGAALVDQLLRRAGRHDLERWAEERRVRRRMGQHALRVRAGYALACSVLAAGVAYYLH